jgi:hypothetical protein
MDRDDRELFHRSIRHATETHTGEALDHALDELGWREALEDDGRAAIAILFELQGRANVTSSSLSRVLAHALGVDAASVAFPSLGSRGAPGVLERGRVHVDGLTTSPAETILVVTSTGDKDVAVTIPLNDLDRREVAGMDPSLGLVEVRGDAAATEVGPVNWAAAAALAQLALGHELVGASRRMLELAREHALERIQFDRPIATFQVVRHRLAETLIAIETAEAALDAGWLDGSPKMAAIAKSVAGRGARTAARHCQQVLAGIGFTTEHPFHTYLKRALVLDELFGSTRNLTRELGEDLLRTRRLPPLLPL